MKHQIVEFCKADNVTAQVHSRHDSGESYTTDLLIGFYDESDVWLARDGNCVEIPLDALEEVIKQLRRAKKLALPKESP